MTLTEYELERQRRMEENRRRMAELGLPQMAEDMAQAAAGDAPPKKKREKREAGPLLEPSRRSNRNEGKERPTYVYEQERGSGGSRTLHDGPLVKEGECEEVYGVRHVLALGSHEKNWDMFTDGYTSLGERIYDPENGASCHQCRQKTLGLRTSCSSCKTGLGMLCGDCLFARYGENVEEAAANESWVCPCCRDLCNCSTHRKKRKWEATGALHRSVKARGYLSVAHYLVLNKAGGLEAKRAALASGFCPPELTEKLEAEIPQLEKEAAAAPPAPEPAQDAAAAEGSKDAQGGGSKRRKSAAGGDKGKGKKGQAEEDAAEAAEAASGAGSKKQKAAGKRAAGKQAAGKEEGGSKAGSKAAVPEGSGKKAQRKPRGKKGQPAATSLPAVPTAAADGALETSGAGHSGAVAADASPAEEAEVTAPALAAVVAAARSGIITKAPFSRKRAAGGLPGSGATIMEAMVAAPARRRRSGDQ